MSIHLKISSTLRKYVPQYNPRTGMDLDWNFDTAPSAGSLAENLGMPLAEIKFVMINGRQQPLDTILQDGDRVAWFPAVGGG